jgi:DNA-binding MarR family transcriptional regulator
VGTADLNEQLVRLVRTLHLVRTQMGARSPGGVPWATYTVLFHLANGGPRRAGALADCVHVDPSTVSRQIDQLVRMGLVERRADPQDRRATLVAATEAGTALHRRVRQARERMLAGLLGDWPARDVDRLTELLTRLNDDLTAGMSDVVATLTESPSAETSDDHSTGA